MSDESALLAAILAHPDEDTPRLMYADWLDEHRQPERAEFIRIQCDSVADEIAEDRAAELEERYRAKWLAGLPQFPPARWEFRRGFPDYLDAPGELFLDHYDAFARAPWLRFLSLYRLENPTMRDFRNRLWSPQWVELQVAEDPRAPAPLFRSDSTVNVIAIAYCPQARQLRRLQFSGTVLGPRAISALVTSPHLEHLHRLHLDGNRDDPRFAPLRERFGDRLVIG
jgi:uncharacterized protein (TIGR02996 family)